MAHGKTLELRKIRGGTANLRGAFGQSRLQQALNDVQQMENARRRDV